MAFIPCDSGTSSYVLFLYRTSISSCITAIHKATSGLFKASWKVDGSPSFVRRQYAALIYVIHSECHVGDRLSRVDRRTSGASDATAIYCSCSNGASEESQSSFPELFSIYRCNLWFFLHNAIIFIFLLQLIFYKYNISVWQSCGQWDPIDDTPSLHQHTPRR